MSSISEKNRNKAYFEHPTKNTQCNRIKMYLMAIPSGLTIADLSNIMGLPKSTISGRINDLKPSVAEAGIRYDEVSKTNVTVWKLVGENKSLFEEKKRTPAKMIKKIRELCLQEDSDLSKNILQIIEYGKNRTCKENSRANKI